MKMKWQYIINVYCISFVLVMFGLSILYNYQIFDFNMISYVLRGFGIAGIILYFINLFINKKIPLWNIFIILILCFVYFSWRHAYSQKVALIGLYNGREGALVIATYYVFLLIFSILKSVKVKKIIFGILTFDGIIQALDALLQLLNIKKILSLPIISYQTYSTGFFYSSILFGTFTTLMVGLWMSKYFFEDSKRRIITYLITMFLLFGLISSGAMSAFVALLGILFLVVFIAIIKRKDINWKKFGIRMVLLILYSVLIINIVNNVTNKLTNDIKKTQGEFVQTVQGNSKTEFGTGRMYIWKESFKYFKDYIWTGIGIDNFPYLGFKAGTFIYDSPAKDNIIYKAHNEYLQILITGGVFLFISYMAFIMYIFFTSLIKIIKSKKKDTLFYSYFLAFCGYLIQAFFNIRIILIAPLFFLIAGILLSYEKTL